MKYEENKKIKISKYLMGEYRMKYSFSDLYEEWNDLMIKTLRDENSEG